MQMPFFQNLSSFHFHPDQKSDTKIPAFCLKQKALVLQEVLALEVSLIQIHFLTLTHFLTLMDLLIHFLSQSLALIRIL